MELKFTFEDGSSGYLQHYGVKGMKWGKHKSVGAVGLQGGGGGMVGQDDVSMSNATRAIDDFVGTARRKLDEAGSHLPENPLHKLKKRTEQAEASGESEAARKRLKERYSHASVLGKNRLSGLNLR